MPVLPRTSNDPTQEIILRPGVVRSVQVMWQARVSPSRCCIGGHSIPVWNRPCRSAGSAWVAVRRIAFPRRLLGNGCNSRAPRPIGAAWRLTIHSSRTCFVTSKAWPKSLPRFCLHYASRLNSGVRPLRAGFLLPFTQATSLASLSNHSPR